MTDPKAESSPEGGAVTEACPATWARLMQEGIRYHEREAAQLERYVAKMPNGPLAFREAHDRAAHVHREAAELFRQELETPNHD